MCPASGPATAQTESGAPGGNHHTFSPPAPLASSPLLSHCSGSAEPTSRTRVGRGLKTARAAAGPNPDCSTLWVPVGPAPAEDLPPGCGPAPETAGSPRPSRRCRSPAPPSLAVAWRAPDASALVRPSPPSWGAPRARQLWAGSAVAAGLLPLPRSSPNCPSGVLVLCSSRPFLPVPSHGGLALGVPHLPRFLLGHSDPER